MSSCLDFASGLHRKHHPDNTRVCTPLLLANGLRVHVHGGSNIGVAQKFLLNFHVNPELTQHARVGVAKRVPADAFSQFCGEISTEVFRFSQPFVHAVSLAGYPQCHHTRNS